MTDNFTAFALINVGDTVECADKPEPNIPNKFGYGNGQGFHVPGLVMEIDDGCVVIEIQGKCPRCTACRIYRRRRFSFTRLRKK